MANFWLGVASSVVAALMFAGVSLVWSKQSGMLRVRRRSLSAARRLLEAGLSNFYSSRDEYGRYRGANSLAEYLNFSSQTIHIVSYWMAASIELENIGSVLRRRLAENPLLTVVVSVVDPNAQFIPLLAEHLDIPENNVRERIHASLSLLQATKMSLPVVERQRLSIKVSPALPVASFILLDVDSPKGRIQVDIKPYKLPRSRSITIEFQGNGATLYRTFRQVALNLLHDAKDFHPPVQATLREE